MILVRRWLPTRAITLLGDGNYSSLDLGTTCVRQQVRLLVPLRLDANLFAPPQARRPGRRGAPRVKGQALPKLTSLLTDPATAWTRGTLPWYAQGCYELEWCSGQAFWYHGGKAPLPLGADARSGGTHPPHAYLQTELSAATIPAAPAEAAPASESVPPPVAGTPLTILGANAATGREILVRYQGRWRLEVTLEESRAHLGVETQRQWSKLAIARSTPGLLGLFSVVVLGGQALHPDGRIPVAQAAGYPKSQATFSDVLATVRRHIWHQELFDSRARDGKQITIRGADLARVMQAAAA